MWIMTVDGFFSAVEDRSDPDRVLVRARTEGDIRALAKIIPGTDPWEDVEADYLWRLSCSKAEWARAVAYWSLRISYPNFKSAIKDKDHSRAYHEVWGVMLRVLQGVRMPGVFREPHVTFPKSMFDDDDWLNEDWLADEDESISG